MLSQRYVSLSLQSWQIKSKCKFRLLVNLEKIIILSSSPNNIIEKSCHLKNYFKKETVTDILSSFFFLRAFEMARFILLDNKFLYLWETCVVIFALYEYIKIISSLGIEKKERETQHYFCHNLNMAAKNLFNKLNTCYQFIMQSTNVKHRVISN